MDVNQLYLEYEQEIIEVLEGDKHLKEIIGLLYNQSMGLMWHIIDDVSSEVEDTEQEELITTLVGFAYPERTKLFYDGFKNGQIKATAWNGLFVEMLEVLHAV